MTPLEDRLRADLRAESVQIEPGSIPPLRLPASGHPDGKPLRKSPRHWSGWMTAIAAAAAVTTVIAGTFLVGHIVTGSGQPTIGEPPYSGIPPYYAYAVQGNTYSRIINGTQYGDSARVGACASVSISGTDSADSWLRPPGVIRKVMNFSAVL